MLPWATWAISGELIGGTGATAKRKRKAPPTDPDRAALETVTQADADEARILREIEASEEEAAAHRSAGKAAGAKRRRKKP
jgi:hypothetical protein